MNDFANNSTTRKDTFARFILKLLFPFAFLSPVLYFMPWKTTLTYRLEKDFYSLSIIVVGTILYIKSRKLYISDTDASGSRNEIFTFWLPKKLRLTANKFMLRFALIVVTAFFISTPIVFCLLVINQGFDQTQPKIIIKEKNSVKEQLILKNGYLGYPYVTEIRRIETDAKPLNTE